MHKPCVSDYFNSQPVAPGRSVNPLTGLPPNLLNNINVF